MKNKSLLNNNSITLKLKDFVLNNLVTIFFIVFCVVSFFVSGMPFEYLLGEIFTRIGRNGFIVLALIIPVLTGMGLNFSVVIGAMAAQVGIFVVINNEMTGMKAFLVCTLISLPIAAFLGFLVGQLFNKMKGSEMIGGLVLGYFADGIYQFIFLFIIGGVINIKNPKLAISGSIGVINAIDLTGNLKYILDDVSLLSVIDIGFYLVLALSVIAIIYNAIIKKQPFKQYKSYVVSLVSAIVVYGLSFVPAFSSFLNANKLILLDGITIFVVIGIIYQAFHIILEIIRKDRRKKEFIKRGISSLFLATGYALTYIPRIEKITRGIKIPVMTYLCIIGLYFFNSWIMKTKLGQDMKTVGQSKKVANAAGINVDKTRIVAMVFSTMLASFGQLIYLQNLGTVQTYGAHNQVGLYAIASLLVGGASVQKATSKQAILGVILFHTLIILSPAVGKALFNNAQIGEYFRVFVTYGVIAISLAMHAYKVVKKKIVKTNKPSDNKVKSI